MRFFNTSACIACAQVGLPIVIVTLATDRHTAHPEICPCQARALCGNAGNLQANQQVMALLSAAEHMQCMPSIRLSCLVLVSRSGLGASVVDVP